MRINATDTESKNIRRGGLLIEPMIFSSEGAWRGDFGLRTGHPVIKMLLECSMYCSKG